MGSAMLAKMVAYVQFLIMVRAFTGYQMGVYAVCLTSVLMAELLANLGFDKVVIRRLARDPSTPFFETSLLMKACTSLVAYALCLAGLHLFYSGDLGVGNWALFSFFAYLPLSALGRSLESHFTALERMAIPAIGQCAERVVLLIFACLAWAGAIPFDVFLASFLGAGLVRVAIPGWLYCSERGAARLRLAQDQARGLLSASSWMFGVEVLAVIYFRVDIFMLSKMLGMKETGFYLTAYKIFEFFISLFSGYITAIFPAMSRDSSRLRPGVLLLGAVAIFFAFSLPVAIWRVDILAFFKPEYVKAQNALLCLVPTLPLIYMNTMFAIYAVATDRIPRLFKAAIPVLGLNISLNLVLIPWLGIQGAALATLLSEVGLCLVLLKLLDPFTSPIIATAGEAP